MSAGKEKTIARKQLIVETAITLFIEKGFHKTSIRDIANNAGISLGNVYNHFAGKAELINAIALLEAEEQLELESILTKSDAPKDVLAAFIDHYIRIHSQPADAAISAEILSEATRNPSIAQGFAKNQSQLIEGLQGLFIRGKKAQQFRFAGDERGMAQSTIDILESACIKSVFYQGVDKQNYLQHLKILVMKMISE